MATIKTMTINTMPKVGTLVVEVRRSNLLRVRTWMGLKLIQLGAWLLFCDVEREIV